MRKTKEESGGDISQLKNDISKKALTIITEILPVKCEQLTQLLEVHYSKCILRLVQDPLFDRDISSSVRASTSFHGTTDASKKRKIDHDSSISTSSANEAMVPCNTVRFSHIQGARRATVTYVLIA
jgi:hypothetical protein